MHESMDKWIDRFGDIPIPVMPHTISQLAKQCKEDVSIHELVELIETDPGLTVQLIRTSSTSLHGRLRSEVTSVQQALMMLGIENLKKLPTTLPNIDKTLKGSAKQHLLKTFSVAYHAARQATDWAKLRRDMVPDEVTAASLLHLTEQNRLLKEVSKAAELYMRSGHGEHEHSVLVKTLADLQRFGSG